MMRFPEKVSRSRRGDGNVFEGNKPLSDTAGLRAMNKSTAPRPKQSADSQIIGLRTAKEKERRDRKVKVMEAVLLHSLARFPVALDGSKT